MFYFDSNTIIPLQCAALVYWTVPATATFYVGTSGKKVTYQITANYSNLRRQKVQFLQ